MTIISSRCSQKRGYYRNAWEFRYFVHTIYTHPMLFLGMSMEKSHFVSEIWLRKDGQHFGGSLREAKNFFWECQNKKRCVFQCDMTVVQLLGPAMIRSWFPGQMSFAESNSRGVEFKLSHFTPVGGAGRRRHIVRCSSHRWCALELQRSW